MKNIILILIFSTLSILGYAQCTPSANNPDSDGDGIADVCDLDDDNDGILDRDELSTCGVPSPDIAPGNGVIIKKLFTENFGTMSTTTGTKSVTLANLGTGAQTTYNYYEATLGTTPTNYQDGSAPPYSLQDNRYTIFNTIAQTATWATGSSRIWQNIGDHTNGGTSPTAGRMFIVNASTTPGEFYRKTFSNIERDIPINASLWVMNLDINSTGNNGRNLPNITVNFIQSGTVVYTFNTGDISRSTDGDVNAWKQYKNPSPFIPTSTEPITIVFVNNSPGGSGNDLAIDDIVIYQAFCDKDNDGIPNHLDLDSDNDGCPDSLEGDENVTLAQLSSNRISGTINTDGVPNLVNSGGVADIGGDLGQGIGTSQILSIQDPQWLTNFGCNSKMYLSQGTNTSLYEVSTSTNPFTYPIVGTASGINYNAIGLNPLDGFIYGILAGSNELIRVSADGNYNNLGAITGLPTGVTYNAGEIDNLGNYYVKVNTSNNQLYKINLSTASASVITLSSSINVPDIAFRVIDGLLYGVNSSNGQLVSINPSTGAVTGIGITITGGVNFGAMFSSSTGEIFGVDNNGGFYQFNLTNGQRVQISGAPSSSANDGAHCVTSAITFDADLYITKTDNKTIYSAGRSNIYTIVAGNYGPFGVLNATISDPVPASIPAANVTYTATVTGGATTSVVGTQTGAINDSVNIPVGGTITYTVTINIPSSFSGNLVNTATITPPANTNDSNNINDSATDTDSGVCYKSAQTTGTTLDANHGITALGRAGINNSNWPMVRKGAWTVLEAKTKGFVVNRLTNDQIAAIPAANLIEGMMVYNTNLNCLQINVDGTSTGWKCFNNQTCPD